MCHTTPLGRSTLVRYSSNFLVRTLFEVHIVKIGENVKVFRVWLASNQYLTFQSKLTPQAKSMVFVEPIANSSEFKHWVEHMALIQPHMDIVGIRAHFTTEMTWKIYQVCTGLYIFPNCNESRSFCSHFSLNLRGYLSKNWCERNYCKKLQFLFSKS